MLYEYMMPTKESEWCTASF